MFVFLNFQAPDVLKAHFSKFCLRLSSSSSAVVKELSTVITTMTKSTKIDLIVQEMNNAVQELQNALKYFSEQSTASLTVPKIEESDNGAGDAKASLALVQIVPLVTVSSLLMEIAARTEKIAEAVNSLANKAEFKVESDAKSKQKSRTQKF